MAEQISLKSGQGKAAAYQELMPQLHALIGDEKDLIANSANLIGALKEAFGYFWIGIYFVKGEAKEELVLGPFQGPPACVRIAFGKGVCGTSWKEKSSIIVPDVNLFPGHIACSPHSRSEIVVPVIKNGVVKGVIDIDSTELSAFDETDRQYLEEVAEIISRFI